MKTLFTFILFFVGVTSFAQANNSQTTSSDLLGEWISEYYVSTNLDGTVRDTFYFQSDSLKLHIGLRIESNSVDEFFDPSAYSKDSIVLMGAGPWIIKNEGTTTKLDFGCEGVFLCGIYDLVSISDTELIIKFCTVKPPEACEIIHLKKRIK